MAQKYSFRPYRSGDEAAINDLYFEVTGRTRTKEQFEWQWLKGPEGPGDIWLIEATDAGGNVKLIGHHGIMPVAFSNGASDLLFGKTENTMVLPGYRKKILYPRFERKFQREYAGRYDALFSTMGPAAAIRQRKAMGYDFPVGWLNSRYTHSFVSEALFAYSLVVDKFRAKKEPTIPFGKQCATYEGLRQNGFMDHEEALTSDFFDDFWKNARLNFSVAPSRRKQDLEWRFWTNPYKDHLTLIVDEGDLSGYCIVSILPAHHNEAFLEDFCVSSNTAREAELLFSRLLQLLKDSGVYSLQVTRTADSSVESYGFLGKHKMYLSRYMESLRENHARPMPRKLTEKGLMGSLESYGWDITGIVLEGRL